MAKCLLEKQAEILNKTNCRQTWKEKKKRDRKVSKAKFNISDKLQETQHGRIREKRKIILKGNGRKSKTEHTKADYIINSDQQ